MSGCTDFWLRDMQRIHPGFNFWACGHKVFWSLGAHGPRVAQAVPSGCPQSLMHCGQGMVLKMAHGSSCAVAAGAGAAVSRTLAAASMRSSSLPPQTKRRRMSLRSREPPPGQGQHTRRLRHRCRRGAASWSHAPPRRVARPRARAPAP